MGSSALIGAAEYLNTPYEHDVEFVDGRIEERPAGELDHGKLQRKLLLLLSRPEFEAEFLCFPEVRVQVAATRFRVPDLTLVSVSAPEEQVIRTPPLLAIEILSPEDSMQRILARVRDLVGMGIAEVWVFDPESRNVQVCQGGDRRELNSGVLAVPGTSAFVLLDEVFSALDRR